MGERLPAGFEKLSFPDCSAVISAVLKEDLIAALNTGTLYDYARARGDVQSFMGRGAALAFRAPASGMDVLVRRSRHGGLLAPLTGELFRRPGRAPHELRTAAELIKRGVATPRVLGYVEYPVAGIFCRIDVLLAFVRNGRDLASFLRNEPSRTARGAAIQATAKLLESLAVARALHPDLNIRNVLIAVNEGQPVAWVLDIDRVQLDPDTGQPVRQLNAERLLRSLRKLMRREGLSLKPDELAQMVDLAGEPA